MRPWSPCSARRTTTLVGADGSHGLEGGAGDELWLLTFSYGFASAPSVHLGDLPPRFGLPLHLASTLGIPLLAVGLGEAAADAENLHGLLLWTTCTGLALHAAASGVAGWIGGAQHFWLLTCALPTVAFPFVVAAVHTAYDDGLRSQALVWLLAVPVFWQFLYAQRHSSVGSTHPAPDRPVSRRRPPG